MRQRQRRDSAPERIRSGAERYGVDGFTAYDDLTLSTR
jgi:hypothetical protein